MNRLFILLFLLPLLSAGCSDEDILPDQKKKFVSFLTSTHNPRLTAESEIEPGSELPFYTEHENTVYRYIVDYYNPDRAGRPEVTAASKVTLVLRTYYFTFTAITGIPDGGITPSNISGITMPYYTNDPEYEEYFRIVGLTPGVWDFQPKTVDMRTSGILNGLYHALLGCREGDRVEAYLTYNMAYGDKEYMYFIPKNSPVAIFFTVQHVA